MSNPFDQFDGPSANPFDQFDDEESLLQKGLGVVETGLGMVAGIPSQIAGGLAGAGSLMLGEGIDKANERLQAVQESNFGFGAYRPSTAAGQRYTENVGEVLQSIPEGVGNVTGAIGGLVGRENAGRYIGELTTGFAMEMLEPGAIYAGARGLANRKGKTSPKAQDILNKNREIEVDITTPDGNTSVGRSGEQLNLFDQFDERSPISPYQTEMASDMWRVDENGIPIRADLSMEIQNMESPLQRNLFGDELDVNFPRDPNKPLSMATGDIQGVERFSEPVNFANDPENARGLTEAIDAMPEGIRNRENGKFAPGTTRQSALNRLRGELPASAELEVAKMDTELASWLEENKKPVSIMKKGRAKKQSGAVWFGDLGESKKLQDLYETLPYRFQALEKLPNKESFTYEQLQQSINRQEVSEAERRILTQAFDIAMDSTGEFKGKTVNAKEFITALDAVSSAFTLKKQRVNNYSDFGLSNIGMDTTNLDMRQYVARMTNEELVNMVDNGILPDWVPVQNKVDANTNLWTNDLELSQGINNHFKDDSYIGHTRNFFDENGRRHVIEIQSDLVQKYKKAGSEALAKYNDSELYDLQTRTQGFLDQVERAVDEDNLDLIFESKDELYLDYVTKLFESSGSRLATATAARQNFTKILDRIEKEQTIRNNRSTTDTFAKNWFVRLIREELADAAKSGETNVRFASADTMAKVEGWPNAITEAEQELNEAKETFEISKRAFDSGSRFGSQESLDFAKKAYDDALKKLREVQNSGQRFGPRFQGIYDRYNKEVSKYLTSIGGKPVTDEKGNTWLEVPVEKHRQRPIMFGQRGVLRIDWSETNKIENRLAASADGTFIPSNPDVSAAIEAAKKQGKDGKVWTYTQSGSTSTAMKTGSPIIQAASRIVQNAIKRADLAIRNFVFPVEQALRSLNKEELTTLGEIMKAEMFDGKRINGDVLAENLSVKQAKAYVAMRDLFDKTLDSQNAARVAMGKKPITAQEAYMSSRWQGDFRQPVYDADGNLVWYLAATTRVGLEAQAKALQKLNAGLVIDPKKAHVVKSTKSGTDLQSAYSTMLDILGRDDPAIQKIKAAIEDQMATEGEMALAQSKHFKKKGNVRGFAGDRPWMNKDKDMVDMFQQQIQYAKNAFRWSEMQKVAEDIKSIVSDPILQDTQPNNIKYIREYYKNALGLGEAEVTRAINDALRSGLGVSPALIDNAVGNVKSFFILQKLAASAGYTFSNLIQAGNVLPYLADLTNKGIIGNPATALPVGFIGGMAMGISHYIKALGPDYMKAPIPFWEDAIKYAEDNGVTARSVYDESPIEDQFSVAARAANLAGKTMTIPETFVRSVAFMTYAQWLKDSGKFPDQQALFQKAEELTNKSMVDYRETERPMMFAKAGAAGNFLNTLQTYPMSFYNQFIYMLGQAAPKMLGGKGQPLGFMALVAFQYAVAGAMGLPGFDDADKLYKWMRDNMTSTETWNKMMKSPFFSDPKMWMLDNLGEASVYGALSDQTGLGMTSRVAAPGAGAMLQSPVGPITDIAKQVSSVGAAALDPTNKTKLAQAAMNVAPVGLQGLLETAPFMEGITYNTRPDGTKVFMKNSDLADRRGGYARTPEEVAVRQWGVRSQKEVLTRDVAYSAQSANQALTKKAGELIDRIYDAGRRGDTKKAAELTQLYIDLTGNPISAVQIQNQIKEEFYTDIEKNNDKSNTARQLLNAAKMNKILKENP